jgi:hypothetical protein
VQLQYLEDGINRRIPMDHMEAVAPEDLYLKTNPATMKMTTTMMMMTTMMS